MRQLFPTPVEDVDGPARYRGDERPAQPGRPWILLDMVTSLDGATSLGDRSGGLSSPADKAVFFALRAVADVVLVGAGTARTERYGPVRLDDEEQDRRRARGQAPLPRLAVVSGRLDLDPGARLFTGPGEGEPPLVLTVAGADPARRRALAGVAEVVDVGDGAVDAGALAQALHQRGARTVTCEGGPTLNGALLGADLVDELCLSLSPLLAGGTSARLATGADHRDARQLRLHRVLEDGGFLFLRYARV